MKNQKKKKPCNTREWICVLEIERKREKQQKNGCDMNTAPHNHHNVPNDRQAIVRDDREKRNYLLRQVCRRITRISEYIVGQFVVHVSMFTIYEFVATIY